MHSHPQNSGAHAGFRKTRPGSLQKFKRGRRSNVFANFGFTNTITGVINLSAGDVYVFTNTLAGAPANYWTHLMTGELWIA